MIIPIKSLAAVTALEVGQLGPQNATEQAFSAHRPTFHLLPIRNWMNDPCAPTYNPATRTYHTWFQYTAETNNWNKIQWGHAWSQNMVDWQATQDAVLLPDQPYDKEGVFTGSLMYAPSGTTQKLSGQETNCE